MKILPVIQNFLPKINSSDNSVQNYPKFKVPFLGNFTPLKEDVVEFVHKEMTGREFKLYGKYMTDLYTGSKMLTNEQLTKMKAHGFFQGSISHVVKKLKPYANEYLDGIEADVFKEIELAAKRDPDFTLPQLFNFWYFNKRNILRGQQKPYFDKIKELGAQLPQEYIEPFYKFMAITDKKLYDTPIMQKFSLKDFTYNVEKMTEKITDVNLRNRIKNLMALLNDETMVNNTKTVSPAIVKKVFDFVNKKVPMKKSIYYDRYMKHYEWDKDEVRIRIIENLQDVASMKGYKRLENLCSANIQMLKGKPVTVPFSNKTFRYNLAQLLENCPDKKLKNKIMEVAKQLPTSSNSSEALILKYKYADANTIGDRLFNPSLVSIEHLVPQSEGGSDFISNCALARRKNNYERMSEPLHETLKQYNHKAQQTYANNLIKLVNKGYISSEDALAQLETIEREGHIKLNYANKLKKRKYTKKEENVIRMKQKYKDK